jgi:hypothetical protein
VHPPWDLRRRRTPTPDQHQSRSGSVLPWSRAIKPRWDFFSWTQRPSFPRRTANGLIFPFEYWPALERGPRIEIISYEHIIIFSYIDHLTAVRASRECRAGGFVVVRPIGVAAAFYPWALRGRSAHPILFASRDAVKPELKKRPFFATAPPGGSPRHLLGRSSSPVR